MPPTLIVVAHTQGREHLLDMTLPQLKKSYAAVRVYECVKGLGPVSAWLQANTRDYEYIIYTSSEILVPDDAVERMRNGHIEGRRSTPLLYFVNRPLLEHVDPSNPHDIQKHPSFGGVFNRWGLYNYQMSGWKHHVCFTGHTKEGWERLGFPPPRVNYGEGDDAWLWNVENNLGCHVHQVDLTVYHLFHGENRIGMGGPGIWSEQNQDARSARLRRVQSQ